jgi:uncharacterized protein
VPAPFEYAIVFVSAVVAGIVNSVAGAGALISFPVLLFLGRPAVVANATNSFGLWPAAAAAAVGFRSELGAARRWVGTLVAPSLIGGVIGAALLLNTSEAIFEGVVPFLLLGATTLLIAQQPINRWRARRGGTAEAGGLRVAVTVTAQFLVGIYAGYFGAGIGILTLAVLGLLGLTDIHQMNGLKNVITLAGNGIAAIYFVVNGAVLWADGITMCAGAVLGGWLGAKAAYKVGRTIVRRFVIGVGIVVTIGLAVRAWT